MTLTVVTGPPAAGKSTWVRTHAKPGDIVIDYDRIANALTGPGADPHNHPKAVRDTAFRARQAAVAEALKHTHTTDVYIIHSLPAQQIRERYAGHDPHIVTLDPGRAVVMTRIAEQRPRAAHAVAERWYSQPHDTTSPVQQASRQW